MKNLIFVLCLLLVGCAPAVPVNTTNKVDIQFTKSSFLDAVTTEVVDGNNFTVIKDTMNNNVCYMVSNTYSHETSLSCLSNK